MQEDHIWAAALREELLMSNCSMKSAQECDINHQQSASITGVSLNDFCLPKHKCVFRYLVFLLSSAYYLCGISVQMASFSSVSLTAKEMQENPT